MLYEVNNVVQDGIHVFTRLYTVCQQASNILITGPESLDGDSVGACIALKEMFRTFTEATIDIFGIPTHQYVELHDVENWKANAIHCLIMMSRSS